MDAEVVKVATSAWQHDAAGPNFFTRPRIMIDHDIFDDLDRNDPDATHGAGAPSGNVGGFASHLKFAMLANATRLCGAQFGNLDLREGDGFRMAALHNAPTAYIEWRQRQPVVHITGLPHIPLARIVRTKAVQHVPDLTKDEAYIKRAPPIVALVESAGARSLLSVPMLKEGDVIGAVVIYRQEVRPFTEKQIELITSFARQAVQKWSSLTVISPI